MKLVSSTFEDCIDKGYFEGVIIKSNPESLIELNRVNFTDCLFENVDFTKIKLDI